MAEDFEQENSESVDFGSYLDIARRRSWHFLIPFFVGWLVIWVVSWILPAKYRSGTLIIVEQPSVPSTLVESNIAEDLQNRLDTITQQILSRTRLLHIIDQFNLYSKDRASYSPDELVERMRKDIEIDLVRSPDHDQLSSFNIYYTSRDPYVAQQVTSELTNLFISENLEVRQQQSENTTNFLANQLEQARQALAAQEEKVRDFNQQHLGELPGQLQGNIEILHGLQSQLENEQGALNAAKEHNVYLESLLGQYRSLERTTGKTGDREATLSGLPAMDQELDRLHAQLADLTSRYTDEYPDVRKVKDQIAKTELMKQQLERQLKSAAQSNDSADVSYASPKDAGPILELQSQLKANQIEIGNRQQAISVLQGRIVQYQAHLNDSPVREQQLAELTRGYNQSKADYDDLLKKKNESERATSLEHEQQGEHFRIQDPPNLPTKPDSPNRLKLFAIGIAFGIFLGGVSTFGAEFLDNRIFTEGEFKRIVPAEVMVEIPAISTPIEEHRLNQSIRLRMVIAGAVSLCIAAAFAITFLRG